MSIEPHLVSKHIRRKWELLGAERNLDFQTFSLETMVILRCIAAV